MIIEHALLPVRPERAADFEAAFAAARPIIASMPGFRSLSLSRGVESPGSYDPGTGSRPGHSPAVTASPQPPR
jgi:heme-degrading monooxygenase HmoA